MGLLETNEQMNGQLDEMKDKLDENETMHEAEIEERELKLKELIEVNGQMEDKHNEEMKESDEKMGAMAIDFKIKEKKTNKMIKELQGQLKKEVIKSQELRGKVLKSSDELLDIREKNEKLNERLKDALDATSSSSSAVSSSGRNGHSYLHHDDHVNRKPSSFVELEVSKSLAKRLEEKEIKMNSF